MTVGLVIVSHSRSLARGVAELAAQMAPDIRLVPAGGTEDDQIGTSFDLVTAALEQADDGDGVVVLYDLGSALLTTETALEFADPEQAERIIVVDAPLVEGAVAASVAAQGGADLNAVGEAARMAGQSWTAARSGGRVAASQVPVIQESDIRAQAKVADSAGIHARPASILARELTVWPDTTIWIGRPGADLADARNVLALIGEGLRQGETVEIAGHGPDAEIAVAKVRRLINAGMD